MQRKRRSGRIAKELPIVLLGTDATGKVFSEETITVVLSRHGAGVVTRYRFSPDERLTLRLPSLAKEAEIRLVGQIGGKPGRYVYGVTFVDPNPDFWPMEFPPPDPFEPGSQKDCPRMQHVPNARGDGTRRHRRGRLLRQRKHPAPLRGVRHVNALEKSRKRSSSSTARAPDPTNFQRDCAYAPTENIEAVFRCSWACVRRILRACACRGTYAWLSCAVVLLRCIDHFGIRFPVRYSSLCNSCQRHCRAPVT